MNFRHLYLAVFLVLAVGIFISLSDNESINVSKFSGNIVVPLLETPASEKETEVANFNIEEKEQPLVGTANPATVYCGELGYQWKINENPMGQQGICIFSDESECDEWDFLRGTCGQQWSYCAVNGYDIITKDDGRNPFTPEYAVCVDEEGNEIGSVTELMNLLEEPLGCAVKSDKQETNTKTAENFSFNNLEN
ncbi:MAG: DUF333 domain-containing protein [Candidatus Diapherotrites archaeon]